MKFVLLIFNIKSNTNIGQLIRTANAFGVEEVCVVGRKKHSKYGSHLTSNMTKMRHFYKLNDAIAHYTEYNYELVGIEISSDSISINDLEFKNNTLFVLGNEGTGIDRGILDQCSYCVYIPQFGSGASLNVNVACGIVLNTFAKRKKSQNKIDGYKFRK